jgi:biotin transport system substrate-specific component
MEKPAMQTRSNVSDAAISETRERGFVSEGLRQVALVVGASLFVALCAHVAIPLPGTPVPLTVQNFAVLLVGLLLGSRRGFAALALYLAEGAMGMPVFSPLGPGGVAQLLGPTGGFLLAYPLVAWLAGFVMERGRKNFARAAVGGFLADVLLFIGGLSWLAVLTHSVAQAFRWGLYWFLFAEVIKVMMAAGIAARWERIRAGNWKAAR